MEGENKKKMDSFFLPNKKQNKRNGDKTGPNIEKKEKRHEQFDENHDVKEKKPFDKKTYRLKKYSKKYKLDQWAEQRKVKLLAKYYKENESDSIQGSYTAKIFDQDHVDSANFGRFVRHPDIIEKENKESKKKNDPYLRAKEKFQEVKQAKIQKKEAIEKAKEEKQKKLEDYKKKKQERFKKLSRKTKKGQPVMTGRMELLLEKIQSGK